MGNHGFRYLLYDIATGIVSWHRLTSFKKLRLTKNVQPYGQPRPIAINDETNGVSNVW